MKAVGYARVSTEKQSETSLETQFDEIKRFAKENKIDLIENFFDKETGKNVNRKNFDKVIDLAFQKKIDAIIVYKYDRFFRNAQEDMKLTEQLAAIKVMIISVFEPFMDVTTPQGFLMRWIGSGINDFYRRNLIQEVLSKSGKVAERGYWLGGNAPFGFKIEHIKDSEGRKRAVLRENQNEAETVKIIFSMYSNGFGFKEIAKHLDRNNIKPRNKESWSHTTIRDMLSNVKYTGTYVWRKGQKHNSHIKREDTIYVEKAIPCIIEPELFEIVQGILKDKAFEKKNKFNYTFSGFVYCGVCGKKLINRSSQNGNKEIIGYYKCPEKHVVIKADVLENQLKDYINTQILKDTIDFKSLAEKINFEHAKNTMYVIDKRTNLVRDLEKINAQIKNYIDLAGFGTNLQELNVKLTELKEERDRINYDLENLLINEEVISEQQLQEKWDDLRRSMEKDIKTTIKYLISKIFLYPSGYISVLEKEIM